VAAATIVLAYTAIVVLERISGEFTHAQAWSGT
jgi:hypothetical protein